MTNSTFFIFQKLKIIAIVFGIFIYGESLNAQTTETFSDETAGELNFTHELATFNTNSNFMIANNSGYGHGDDQYMDNYGHTNIEYVTSIMISTGNLSVQSLWVYPSNTSDAGFPSNGGTVIVRGLKDNIEIFTATLESANIRTDFAADNGFSFFDLSTHNAKIIDELEFTLTSQLRYLAVDDITFSTVSVNSPPTVTTTITDESSISSTSATLGGNVTADGGASVTERGVVYSTTDETPTIAEGATKDANGTGTGIFSESIGSLSPNTTYYYNSYAINSEGTSYGTANSLTTDPDPATVTTQAVTDIAMTTATGKGNVTDLGVPNPTQHGVCWNTGGTPTTLDSKTEDGAVSATGAFTSSITSLSPNTTYYVRAYVTNTAGTTYGTQESFTTDPEPPTVTTLAVSSIGMTTATGNGNITDLGAPNPTQHGVCWNTIGTPTTSDSKTTEGTASATGAFTSSITSLSPNTTYYVRTYAINIAGTSYGNQVSFTTDPEPATVTTQSVTDIAMTTATGNGNVTDLGDPNPTQHGVCWNTGGTPTLGDSKTEDGAVSVTGAFTSSITNLNPNTTYYVRAYVTNTAGTTYGTQESFTTDPEPPTVTTLAVSSIGMTTATGNGNITDLGAPNPTQHGVCWNTLGTPTTSDSKTTEGPASATGAFTSSITSLSPNTTYYVRAYATNSAGTSYGSQVSFTSNPEPATVTTQAITSITATTATGNGNTTSLGDPNPHQHGVCWNTAGNPTLGDSKTEDGAVSATGAFTSNITSLSSNTTYYVRAYVTNTAGTTYGTEVSFTTPLEAPNTQATEIVFSTNRAASSTISWTNGNGNNRAVFVKQTGSGTASPADDATYTANTRFGDGTQIGTSGWYCIYNGTETSVTITGLIPDTEYSVHVCEYNGISGSEKYLVTSASNNPATQTMQSILINEIDTDTESTDVLEFIELYDGGTGNVLLDGLAIVLYNGTNDESYKSYDLDGYSTDANGYFVIGNTGVTGVDLIITNNSIQNGADAIALYSNEASNFPNGTAITSDNLIDAIIYDTNDADDTGLISILTPGQNQINENEKNNKDFHSLQRIPNGSGGLLITSSYQQYSPTPGERNNISPSASNFTASLIYQNSAYAFTTADFGYTDGDSDPLDHVRISTVPATGTLWIDTDNNNVIDGAESAITDGGTISKTNLDAGFLKYLNTNGTSSEFSFDVNDGIAYSSSSYTAALTVIPEPTVTLALDPESSISENGGNTGIKATLSHIFDKTVTVNLAFSGTSEGTDYSVAQTHIEISSGNLSNTLTLTGSDDALVETNETIIVDISFVTNGSESGTQQITCTLTDDDNYPVITVSQSFSVDEGTANTTAVGIVLATDEDAGTNFSSWTITDGNTDGIFDINAGTGEITVIDNTKLDYETTTTYTLSITVSDGTNTSVEESVSININDINDNTPIITTSQSFAINENAANSSIIGTVLATDEDAGTSFSSWTITDGNTDGIFDINDGTGEITVIDNTKLDYETTTTYTMSITVSDGTNTSIEESVTININDINDNTPVITTSQSFAINENLANASNVGTISVTDADASTIYEAWTITGGNTENAFAIDQLTGEITVNNITALDRETIEHFELMLSVSDGLNTSPETMVIITLNDLNDNKPMITAAQEFILYIEANNGDKIGTIVATDIDVTATTFQNWTIVSGNGNSDADANEALALDPTTGEISLNDADDLTVNDNFTLSVAVSDGTNTSDLVNVLVLVKPANNPPSITSANTANVIENTTAVITVTATDTDGDTPTFEITGGADQNLFEINTNSGELVFKSAPNFENALDADQDNVCIIEVTAYDGKGKSDTQQISITIVNTNETPLCENQTFDIAENSTLESAVGTVIATDEDNGQSLTYAIISGNTIGTEEVFEISSTDGQLSVLNNGPLDFEQNPKMDITVQITDNGDPALSSEAIITVNITDINEAPQIEVQNFNIDENSPAETQIGSIIATDEDNGQSLTYSIISDNSNGYFSIDPSTGILIIDNPDGFDYETNPVFNIEIGVSDDHSFPLSNSATIEVTVNNLNDNAPAVEAQSFSINENSEAETVVGTVAATDADGELNDLSFTIISGNTNDAFILNAATGEITVNSQQEMDFETNPVFELVVNVTDGIHNSEATITVNLNDLNDTGIEDFDQIVFSIYPNPSKDIVKVDLSKLNSSDLILEVINMDGTTVLKREISTGTVIEILDLTEQAKGFYFIRVYNKHIVKTQKLLLK